MCSKEDPLTILPVFLSLLYQAPKTRLQAGSITSDQFTSAGTGLSYLSVLRNKSNVSFLFNTFFKLYVTSLDQKSLSVSGSVLCVCVVRRITAVVLVICTCSNHSKDRYEKMKRKKSSFSKFGWASVRISTLQYE